MRIAVIDVGTNSVRLFIAEQRDGPALHELRRELIITRLGEGVDRERVLGDEPLRRTVDAIATYAADARDASVDVLRIIATSAVRDAANRDDFVRAVAGATGNEPEILSGESEARLGFAGATADIATPSPSLVVDIGGGSTELVRGAARAERWISLDIGSVRLTERHIRMDPPSPDDLAAVRRDADAALATASGVVDGDPIGTLVGLAGTITTVAAISLGLTGYDREAIHHARLARPEVVRIRELLASMTSVQRRKLPAMPPGREDVIVAGVVILEQVMERIGVEECLVSESDILDGAAIEALAAGGGASG